MIRVEIRQYRSGYSVKALFRLPATEEEEAQVTARLRDELQLGYERGMAGWFQIEGVTRAGDFFEARVEFGRELADDGEILEERYQGYALRQAARMLLETELREQMGSAQSVPAYDFTLDEPVFTRREQKEEGPRA